MTGLIPNERRAEGIGYWGMATVLATAFAPALGLAIFGLTGSIVLGAIIGRAGFPAAYGIAAALAVLSVPAFLLLDRRAFPSGRAVSSET